MLTTLEALPPAPVQFNVYVAAFVIGPTVVLPEVFWIPDQLPDAVQDVALVEVHINISVAANATEVEAATKDTVGTGAGAVTVSLTKALPEPPAPVHVSVNVAF